MSDLDPYGQGITVTTLTDAPNAEALARALAGLGSMVPQLVMRFASAAERSATLVDDAAPAAGMTTWLIDVKHLDIYTGTAWLTMNPDTVITNTGATAASGFTVVGWAGWKAGRMVTINLGVARTSGGDILSDQNGNIGDTPIGTIPAGYRPPEMIYAGIGDGFGNGECSIAANGLVTVRSWSTNGAGGANAGIITNRNLRVTKTFIQP